MSQLNIYGTDIRMIREEDSKFFNVRACYDLLDSWNISDKVKNNNYMIVSSDDFLNAAAQTIGEIKGEENIVFEVQQKFKLMCELFTNSYKSVMLILKTEKNGADDSSKGESTET